ncbi:MAG: hypothetical protein Q4Q62_03540 [Thermoplasmata archaeon]|nr:hypothetical protein [Thermoplasmata archaeon]
MRLDAADAVIVSAVAVFIGVLAYGFATSEYRPFLVVVLLAVAGLVALSLSIILDPWLPSLRPCRTYSEGDAILTVHCSRYIEGGGPVYVFADGTLVARVNRGTVTEVPVKAGYSQVCASRSETMEEWDVRYEVSDPDAYISKIPDGRIGLLVSPGPTGREKELYDASYRGSRNDMLFHLVLEIPTLIGLAVGAWLLWPVRRPVGRANPFRTAHPFYDCPEMTPERRIS